MKRAELGYLVKQGSFIDKWLISGLVSTPLSMTPTPDTFPGYYPGCSVKDEHGKERKSPAKSEYIKKGEFRELIYPEDVVTDKLYYPADTKRVDCSAVFKFPSRARLYARAYINSDEEISVKAAMFACGGMKVWVNKNLVAEYYPYEANIECRKDFELRINKGVNELFVALDDYGERNINFKFGLKVVEGSLNITLPVSADVDKIERMRACLNGLYTNKLNYHEESVYLCSESPFENDFEFELEAEDLEPVSRSATKGERKVKLFDVGGIVSGYHEFTLSTIVEGVTLTTAFCIQVCPGEAEKLSLNIKDYENRRKFCLEYAAVNGNSLDNYIAALECGNADYTKYEKAVCNDLDFAQRRGDCADFRVQRFLWLMLRYSKLIPGDLKDRIEKLILGFRYWFDEPGNDAMWFFSENHALAFHCDELIAGQLYEDKVFTNSGLTGHEHVIKAKTRIVEWFDKLLKYGYNEWNSATYVNVDVFTYITLYCFAKDSEIKALAGKALDKTFEMYAYNSFKGVMGTSNGRTYDKDILGNDCMSGNSQMWLAWGVGCINRRVSPALYIAISDYVPSDAYKDIASGNFKGRLIRTVQEGTMEVPTYLCKTSKYILGTCVSPRTGGPGSQELLISMFLNDTSTRIWINLPGEGKVFGIRRPGYFSGNALTPLVTQKENVAVVSYHFLKAFTNRVEVDYVHVICDTKECDEVILKGNALFIRRGDAFGAIISTVPLAKSGKTCLSDMEFVTDRIESEWLVKVSDNDEFSDFESFVEYHTTHKPKIIGRKLYFDDYRLGKLKFSLLTKDYLIRKVGPKKLVSLGASKDMVKQFLKEIFIKRR